MASPRLRDLGLGGKREIFYLEPKDIKIRGGFNCRDFSTQATREHIDGLKASIRAIGIYEAITVQFIAGPTSDTSEAICVNGESRVRAALELVEEGHPVRVPCQQDDSKNDEDRLIRQLVSNTGQRFSELESGEGFKRFVAWGWTPEQIAEKTGFKVRHINHCLELANASRATKELVKTKQVTPALAVQHIKTRGERAAASLQVEADKAKASGRTIATREVKRVPAALELAVKLAVQEVEDAGQDAGSDTVTISRSTYERLKALLQGKAASVAAQPTAEAIEPEEAVLGVSGPGAVAPFDELQQEQPVYEGESTDWQVSRRSIN